MNRTEFTPEKGKVYQNEGGGIFDCMSEPDQAGRVLMRNRASGWTFYAHGIGIYEDDSIDWDYSTEGHFDTETTPIVNVQEIASAAVQKWGKAAQIDMAIEEMSELIKALLKERRAIYGDPEFLTERAMKAEHDIAEEMADVSIMLLQLEIIFQNGETFREIRDEKVQRLRFRIEESEGGRHE